MALLRSIVLAVGAPRRPGLGEVDDLREARRRSGRDHLGRRRVFLVGVVLWIVLKILLIAVPVIGAVAFYVVWERKLIGWMHVRHGPMYVGMGIFQAFADVFKLLF